MISIIVTISWILIAIIMCVMWWILRCNDKAAEQRRKLIYAVSSIIKNSGYKEKLSRYDVFDEIPYEKHFWHLVFCKDPMKLYPRDLVEVAESDEMSVVQWRL